MTGSPTDYEAGLCEVCRQPGREFCVDCDRPSGECHEEQTFHACPDCQGHGLRHEEGYIACPEHERAPMLPLEGA